MHIRRAFLSLVGAAALVIMPLIASAQDAYEGGPGILVLDYQCGSKYADRLSLAACQGRQSDKADRWLAAILASYTTTLERDIADVVSGGGTPFDTIAQLRASQAAFEAYRKEAVELAFREVIGMGGVFEAGRAYFELTTDRARFLLYNCRLLDKIDLTASEWCQ